MYIYCLTIKTLKPLFYGRYVDNTNNRLRKDERDAVFHALKSTTMKVLN